ncbi:HAMP domain-containing sensor histidine kinase [Treponema sp. C6A8]|uniref:HAMP domain-containing sensor histidine kinase n=1 Tax=Treponema sp. C6A8 TaxID=1410609 RepID=UPI000684675A|nr:HAMP domain-containing sensor histidine kinase [Treponema sp. C6A8]
MKNNAIKKFLNSFPFRLSLSYTKILATVLIATIFAMVLFVDRAIQHKQSEELKFTCEGIANNLSMTNGLEMESEFFLTIPYYITYSVYNSHNGFVYYTNDPLLPCNLKTSTRARIYYEKNYFSDGDLKILYYAKDCSLKESDIPLRIIAAIYMDTDYAAKLSQLFPYTLVPFLLILIFIAFIISYLTAKRTIEPVVRMTENVRKLSSTELDAVLPLSSRNDELDNLALTFNSLFERIKKDFERERQFSSDVSHELKTPLAVITGQSKLLLRWGKDDPAQLETSLIAINNEAKSMKMIIENLLQMSRYESGILKPEYTKINVKAFFDRLKNEFSNIDTEKTVKVEIDCDERMEINSDAELLHQTFTAFMTNSVKFCNKEVCLITLKAYKGEEKVFLCEADNGEGFSEADLTEIFNRFYTGNSARTRNLKKSSTGLGLAIAKTLTSVLGGKISAANNPDGGALLTVELPSS